MKKKTRKTRPKAARAVLRGWKLPALVDRRRKPRPAAKKR
jgi:hypothetical protein